ncbi:hypothetical protein [Romboutsia ilealis]|nr:hypothetical protein [Romboutsia ilealis]
MENLKIEIQKIIDEIEEMIKNNDTKENIEIKRKELDKLLNRYIEKL